MAKATGTLVWPDIQDLSVLVPVNVSTCSWDGADDPCVTTLLQAHTHNLLQITLPRSFTRMKQSPLWSIHEAKLKLTKADHQQLQAEHAYGKQNTAALNTSSVVWSFCKESFGFLNNILQSCYKRAIVASKLLQDKVAPSGLRLMKTHNLAQRITLWTKNQLHHIGIDNCWTSMKNKRWTRYGGKSSKYHASHSLPPYHKGLQDKSGLLWTPWHS